MKAKRIIFAVAALLTFSTAASAQGLITDLFEKINKKDGLGHTGEEKTFSTDSAGITIESRIIYVSVGQPNFNLFDKLKVAFEEESGDASWTYSYIGSENGSPRRQWSIWREDAEPVLVGNTKNSSYIIANFDDKERPNYRTCCAVEWSDGSDQYTKSAKLIYVYGRKPQNETPQTHYFGTATYNPLGTVTLHSNIPYPNLPTNLKEQLQGLRNLPDSLYTIRVDRLDDFENGIFGNGKPQDIPLDGDLNEWMAKATNNVSHLSNSDWHRFFGLMTQKMIDRANKESAEDLVVAAGIVLNLCKNASQLDADEREVSARRLEDVAEHYFTSDKHQYIYDLLMLGAKKLQKK
jgi:hypothetical protein